jgi:sulfoxide reductase heme-binding subunit YedZ
VFLADTIQIATQRVSTAWPWYVVRGAGFVAAALLGLLVLSGIGQVTGLTYRYLEPIKAWAIHKTLAFALLGAIIVHVGFLLVDKFLPFSFTQIFVPFASLYNNKTTILGLPLSALGITMGILAMYGVIVLIATSLGWIDRKRSLWRNTHFLSYGVAVLVFLHGLYVGSDLKYGLFRNGWTALGLLTLVAIIVRLWRAGTLKRA